MSFYAMLCYVMLCYVMIYNATSYHVVLDAIRFHWSHSIVFSFFFFLFCILLFILFRFLFHSFSFFLFFCRPLSDVEEDLVFMCIDVLQGNQLDLIKSRKSILSSKFKLKFDTIILMLKPWFWLRITYCWYFLLVV